MMPRAFGIAGKGGTAKTWSAWHLSHALSDFGNPVLMIDANEQSGGLSHSKDLGTNYKGRAGLAELLKGEISLDGATYEVSKGVSILPSGNDLEDVDVGQNLYGIAERIQDLSADTIVMIDTAPDLRELFSAAAIASDDIICVAAPKPDEIGRICDIAAHLQFIHSNLEVYPKLSGVILTRVQGTRSNAIRGMIEKISKRPDYLGRVRYTDAARGIRQIRVDYEEIAQEMVDRFNL